MPGGERKEVVAIAGDYNHSVHSGMGERTLVGSIDGQHIPQLRRLVLPVAQ
jgi:hypothetical protein